MGRMRAVVIEESLAGGRLPPAFPGQPIRRYRHPLDEDTMITIAEVDVPHTQALDAAMRLARCLLPRHYYAHLLDNHLMYVAFPNCVVVLDRDDQAGQDRAQAVGRLFDIPVSQMRFLEMFDTDHPDAR